LSLLLWLSSRRDLRLPLPFLSPLPPTAEEGVTVIKGIKKQIKVI